MSEDYNQVIILKRNNDEEKRKNYKKIYDLSLIDSIKNITQDEKIILLSTIKKILLCTYKYIDEYNRKCLLEYVLLLVLYFIIYLIIFLPIFRFIIMTEEQITYSKGFTIYKKLKNFIGTHFIVVVYKMAELSFTRSNIKKLLLYYARQELKKIKKNFIISIDDKNFDLKIKRNNQKFENESNQINEFYQYVICYPNFFYDIDCNIITPLENSMFYLTRLADAKIIHTFKIVKYNRLIYFFFEIISFYYLTLARIKMYNIILVVLFLIDALIEFYYKIKRYEGTKIIQYKVFRKYLSSGYFINMGEEIIEIFKLNKNYEEEEEEKLETDFLNIYKKIEDIHDKVSTWL